MIAQKSGLVLVDEAAAERVDEWTGADFDSYEVLALLHVPNPIDRVTRARAPRRERASGRSAR